MRFPLEPLIEGRSLAALAELVGASHATTRQWSHRGLSYRQAEAVTDALGMHPVEVWPWWYEFTGIQCANDECGEWFIPVTAQSRCCSRSCRDKVRYRRLKAASPSSPQPVRKTMAA